MPLPTDWYCLARNLGYKYYLSIATSGDYMEPLVADVDEIAAIARLYKAHVAALESADAP